MYKHSSTVDKRRIVVIIALVVFGFIVTGIRIVGISMVHSEDPYFDHGEKKPRPERSKIVDRNGILLSSSIPTASLYANPQKIRNPESTAKQIAKTLPKVGSKELIVKFESNKQFIWIARHITPKQQIDVNSLGLPGVYLAKDFKRIYPQTNLVSHIIGKVDTDSRALSGVEKYLDPQIHGQKDDLILSLDIRVQNILHKELEKKVKEVGAKGAAAIILNSSTGEVLAMVSLPDFDPNKSSNFNPDSLFNRATLGLYEMGSTFKIFTMAAALENKAITLDEIFDVSKPLKVSEHTINDYFPNKRLSAKEIFSKSSNIGMAKIALRLGIQPLKNFLGELGLLSPLKIEIPEKSQPLVTHKWTESTLVTVSYGYGIATSLMHIAQAVGAIANEGNFCSATFILERHCQNEKRILSKESAKKMLDLMSLVVQKGTGKKASVSGYEVGGKTGSAEKIINGAYSKDHNLSSFVGVFPIHNPLYVVAIMIDEPDPRTGLKTGGITAAPVASSIIKRIGPILNVAPK